MLHFALQSGGVGPIQDDQGQVGVAIFSAFTFDGTTGGGGDTKSLALFLFNDDVNFKYNAPVLSLPDTDLVAQQSWFTLLDNKFVAGITPTELEFSTFGVSGTGTLTLDDISQAGGPHPERKFWIRAAVPDGIATANLTGVKMRSASVEEAV